MNKRVTVALSGGVDSTVAAHLLLEQGYSVEGVTMRLIPSWISETKDDEVCARASAVVEKIGIPHHIVDLRDAFEQKIIATYAQAYAKGLTPNPCITCNQEIKFGLLWEWAQSKGFDYLATGHYAATAGKHLKQSVDTAKDQTYFMYRIPRAQLWQVLFPLEDWRKSDVKRYATELDLCDVSESESQDACFIAGSQREEVIKRWCPEAFEPGRIVAIDGRHVGMHQGIGHYTVGQRKGLGIGGQVDPLYVVRIDSDTNEVVVGPRSACEIIVLECTDSVVDYDALGYGKGTAGNKAREIPDTVGYETGNSIGEEDSREIESSFDEKGTCDKANENPRYPLCALTDVIDGVWKVDAMARYNMTPAPALLGIENGHMTITFDKPLAGISLGQSAVCYKDGVLVAGGVITCAR
jgi:tRNA-specific 2-thiouridylase